MKEVRQPLQYPLPEGEEKSRSEFTDQPDDQADDHTQNDHRGYREIKRVVLFFYADVTGQVPKPPQFVMKQPDDYSD
jgi:hypothetical protein